jgi:hypothetical protein
MKMTEKDQIEWNQDGSRTQLWLCAGFILPPIAWGIQLQTVYLLSEYGCSTNYFLPIHVVSVAALLLSLTGVFISWRNWQQAGAKWKSEDGVVVPRSRFLAIVSLLSGSLLTLLTFAQWLPTLMGVPCDK